MTTDDSWVMTISNRPDAFNDALPWRKRLATWPDSWREQWGRRANALEEGGMDWVEAEKQAWNETIVTKKAAIHQHAESDRQPEPTRPGSARPVKHAALALGL